MLPSETMLALFPRGVMVCKAGLFRRIRLHAVSLAHAAVLEAYGCPLGPWHPESKALVAAWILSHPASEVGDLVRSGPEGAKKFLRRLKKCARTVANATNHHMASALLTFVPPKSDGENVIDDGLGQGYGWPLEVVEALCSAYGMSFDDALHMDVARALALLSVRRGRNDMAGGPDYFGRIRLQRMKEAGIIGSAEKEG